MVRRHWLTRLSDERTASLRTFWGAFEPLPPHPVGDCTLTAYRRQLHHHFAQSTTKRCHRMHRGLATHTPPFHLIGCMLLAWICDPLSAQDLAAVAAVMLPSIMHCRMCSLSPKRDKAFGRPEWPYYKHVAAFLASKCGAERRTKRCERRASHGLRQLGSKSTTGLTTGVIMDLGLTTGVPWSAHIYGWVRAATYKSVPYGNLAHRTMPSQRCSAFGFAATTSAECAFDFPEIRYRQASQSPIFANRRHG